MGKEGNSGAVVDSNGAVFGVSGLRVVDASAFPFTPPGHTQSTVCKSSHLEECRKPLLMRDRYAC